MVREPVARSLDCDRAGEPPFAPSPSRREADQAQRENRDGPCSFWKVRQSVREALTYRPEAIVELFATPNGWERHPDIRAKAAEAEIDVEYVTEYVLNAMADTVTPQGLVAVVQQTPTSVRDIFDSSPRLVAICEEVRDPGNLGTIIRAADAAECGCVVLTGRTVDPYNPKVVRATTGSLFTCLCRSGEDLADVVTRAHAAGSAHPRGRCEGRRSAEGTRRGRARRATAWLFGNEARGLEDEALALADQVLKLPIFGRAESLNLATAASVCLYESAFAQRATSAG